MPLHQQKLILVKEFYNMLLVIVPRPPMTSKQAKRRYAAQQPKITTAQLWRSMREEEAQERREREEARLREKAERERASKRIRAQKRKLEKETQQQEERRERRQQGLPEPGPWLTPDQRMITTFFQRKRCDEDV